jgi:hypothetical protein
MTGHGAKFGRKKEQAIVALLSQRSVEDAARVAGVGTKTLGRWMTLPQFRQEYLEARRQAFGQATARLQQASGVAVSILMSVMLDTNAPASSRVRAAACVLDRAATGIEIEDMEMRRRSGDSWGLRGSRRVRSVSRHEALGYGNEEGRLKSWLSREGPSLRFGHITLHGLTKCLETPRPPKNRYGQKHSLIASIAKSPDNLAPGRTKQLSVLSRVSNLRTTARICCAVFRLT